MKVKDLPWHIIINGSIKRVLNNRQMDQNDSKKGRIYGKHLKLITKYTWKEYEIVKELIPDEPKIGNKMLISVACIDLCLLNALKRISIEESYARSLVADINWNLMHKYLKFPIFLLITLCSDKFIRLKIFVNSILIFPFTRPGYKYKYYIVGDIIKIEMERCPISDYYKNTGNLPLCKSAWCDMDYQLFKILGGRLNRDQTLASNCSYCSFNISSEI